MFDLATVMIVWEMQVSPAKRDEFVAMTAQSVDASRQYDGNLQFDILVDEARPDTVVFIEKWASEDIRQTYMAWRAETGGIEQLQAYLTAAPKITILRQAVE